MEEDHEQERKEELFMDYVGQCLWTIETLIKKRLGVRGEIPQYVELAHPETKLKNRMTAEEIKQHVLELLRC